MPHRTSSSVPCQILLGAALVWAAPLAARADPGIGAPPTPDVPAVAAPTSFETLLKRLSAVRLFGSASLDWRNVGPRTPGYETQIQDEVYLADMYFGA